LGSAFVCRVFPAATTHRDALDFETPYRAHASSIVIPPRRAFITWFFIFLLCRIRPLADRPSRASFTDTSVIRLSVR
jgi:hypothetical protein